MAAPGSKMLQHLQGWAIFLLQLAALSASVTFSPPPPPRYDVVASSLWHCHHNFGEKVLYELWRQQSSKADSDDGTRVMEIIHIRRDWVEFISSEADEDSLAAMGLHPCHKSAPLGDLIAAELEESVGTFQHHTADSNSLDTFQQHVAGSEGQGGTVEQPMRGTEGRKREEPVRNVLNRVLRSSGGQVEREGRYAFDHYLNFSAIKSWFEELSLSHPSLIALHPSIGTSYYERDIFAVHVTDNSTLRPGETRPKIYLQCLLHPREWITGPVCMYITEQLVQNSLFKNLLHRVEVVVVPVANPDGYFVTWYDYPKYRLWRKNAQPMENPKCVGVDLNRNFDSHWTEDASRQSDDPCDELYRGPKANSELEVKAITEYLKSLGPSLIGAIDFHSFSQEILYPPAWSDIIVDGGETIQRVAESVASTTSTVGVPYTASRMVDIYSATGTLADWLLDLRHSHEACSSMIPLTVELRPAFHPDMSDINLGFVLPKTQIYPTCTEMLIAFTEFAELVQDTGKECYTTREKS